MDRVSRIRWAILMAALTCTVAAIFLAGPSDSDPPARTERRVPAQGNRPLFPSVVAAQAGVEPPDAESDADPFAPRGWQAVPPPPPAPAPAAHFAVAPVDLTPPGPPPLPFRFVGGFADGSEHLVYLALGERALVAHTGDVLDSTYKVLAIGPTQIEFEHIPTSIKQTLVIPVRDN